MKAGNIPGDKAAGRQRKPSMPRGYTIPLIDLARETRRQVIVDREKGQYLGHPTTVLLEDGKTMIVVYPKGHGRGAIVMKRSTDGGLTWSKRLRVPANWATSMEVPTIYRTVGRKGVKRLIMFSGLYPIRMAVSEDDGKTWTPLEPIGDFGGVVAMASCIRLNDGRYMAMFHDDGRFLRGSGERSGVFTVYKTVSADGGLTWGEPDAVTSHPKAHLCEPGAVRSPDGGQLCVLLRENSRVHNSFVIFSKDEGQTWTKPRELPGSLTGDRHTGRYAPDGRLFISFRDTTHESPTKGDWVGWVGTYDDIVRGREGQYRVRLMDNLQGGDCAYPAVELLPDGTFVTTTYGHWAEGEQPYIASVRFKTAELDERARKLARHTDGGALYNGIRPPAAWPPKRKRLTRAPMAVPYLKRPPKSIPIDVGRQLFVDDFLVEKTTLRRTFHQAEYHPACPVLTATKPWERDGKSFWAAPFSDGVWYDPQDGKFKMWYAGSSENTCYAESKDGVRWTKPKLDVYPGTNIVLKERRDSSTVWLDHEEKKPARRYKLLYLGIRKRRWSLILRYSPDGIHFSRPAAVTRVGGDRSTFFHNPFRGLWVYSLRTYFPEGVGRARAYREHTDLAAGLRNCDDHSTLWLCADKLDPHHTNPKYRQIEPQLYNFDAAAYESIMLGLFSIWEGPDNAESRRVGNHKRCEILLGFSRDGFHFSRPCRKPFIGVNEVDDAWNWGNVQSAGGGCLVVGDKLHFYVSGRALDPTGRQGNMSTGLAILRRDGFTSMDAGKRTGTLTTRPVTFKGTRLFVNVNAAHGELRAEVLDKAGKVIAPFTRANCLAVKADKTLAEVKWKGAGDLSSLAARPVRLRFHLRNGSLYSFWVSPYATGASCGYVAAGGPSLYGARDAR